MAQRRKLRILAAAGLAATVLALPAVASASYIPDVLDLAPDAGYRFNEGEPFVPPPWPVDDWWRYPSFPQDDFAEEGDDYWDYPTGELGYLGWAQ